MLITKGEGRGERGRGEGKWGTEVMGKGKMSERGSREKAGEEILKEQGERQGNRGAWIKSKGKQG